MMILKLLIKLYNLDFHFICISFMFNHFGTNETSIPVIYLTNKNYWDNLLFFLKTIDNQNIFFISFYLLILKIIG